MDIRIEDDTIKIFGQILFVDGSLLYFFGYHALGELRKYRFHWQTRDGNLISRWDNAPHFTSMKTFPDHKHTPIGTLPSGRRAASTKTRIETQKPNNSPDCDPPPEIRKKLRNARGISIHGRH
jgi:hypothetical protein